MASPQPAVLRLGFKALGHLKHVSPYNPGHRQMREHRRYTPHIVVYGSGFEILSRQIVLKPGNQGRRYILKTDNMPFLEEGDEGIIRL
jgi:hypothetical protein